MMMVRFLLALGLAATPGVLTAGVFPPVDSRARTSDSTRVYPIGEVVVTGSRISSEPSSLPSPVALITASDLQARPGNLVADGLDGQTGLALASYGGTGSVQTAAIRGMSSEHTLVLIDGERLNSFQNSTVDLGMLSTLGLGRIEIARGGSSALYGSDAVGGVINLIPESPAEEIRAAARASFGSNHYSAFELRAGGGTGSVAGSADVRRERGRGDFAYDFSDGGSTTRLQRTGADFEIVSTSARVRANISETVNTTALVLYSDADRGSPGPVTDPSSSGQARLHDRLIRLQTAAHWIADDRLVASLSLAWTGSTETYNDPQVLLGGAPLKSYYDNHALFLTPQVEAGITDGVTLDGGIELGYGSLTSSDVRDSRRWQHSPYVSSLIKIEPGLPFLNELVILPSVRYDGYSDVDGDISPKLGLNAAILPGNILRLRASYGKSFRVPTFNELYWTAGGNSLLQPERSLGFDGGVVSEMHAGGSLTVSATYFSLDTRDRIVWIPQSGGFWSPQNIARVVSRGLEAEARWSGFDRHLEIGFNSTWTFARKESEDFPGDPTYGKDLMYVPRQVVNASVTLKFDAWSFFVEHRWTSFRYTTETNDRFLSSYAISSAAVRYEVPIGAVRGSVKLEGTNLFNTSYQVIALYPMPLRELRMTVGVDR